MLALLACFVGYTLPCHGRAELHLLACFALLCVALLCCAVLCCALLCFALLCFALRCVALHCLAGLLVHLGAPRERGEPTLRKLQEVKTFLIEQELC